MSENPSRNQSTGSSSGSTSSGTPSQSKSGGGSAPSNGRGSGYGPALLLAAILIGFFLYWNHRQEQKEQACRYARVLIESINEVGGGGRSTLDC